MPPAPPGRGAPMAPIRTRLIVFTVMLGVAVASIWLIDRRAMLRMHELEAEHEQVEQP